MDTILLFLALAAFFMVLGVMLNCILTKMEKLEEKLDELIKHTK